MGTKDFQCHINMNKFAIHETNTQGGICFTDPKFIPNKNIPGNIKSGVCF